MALTLSQVKQATGSNLPLLGADPTSPTSRTIQGVPLYTSEFVAANTVWAISGDRTYTVVRDDATLEADRSVYWSSDHVGLKTTMRVAPAFAHAASVVRITLT